MPSASLDPRFRLANERTLLSWMRVALALVAAGTTAGTVVDIDPRWLHAGVAIGPIAARPGRGAARLHALAARSRTSMRTGVELPPDRELRLVAIAVALIAVRRRRRRRSSASSTAEAISYPGGRRERLEQRRVHAIERRARCPRPWR